MTTTKPAQPAAPNLARIIELTFQDAVNGHLNDAQTITREEIGEVYEIARNAEIAYPRLLAERAELVAALRRAADAMDGPLGWDQHRDDARALLAKLGEE